MSHWISFLCRSRNINEFTTGMPCKISRNTARWCRGYSSLIFFLLTHNIQPIHILILCSKTIKNTISTGNFMACIQLLECLKFYILICFYQVQGARYHSSISLYSPLPPFGLLSTLSLSRLGGSGPIFSKLITTPDWTFCTMDSRHWCNVLWDDTA